MQETRVAKCFIRARDSLLVSFRTSWGNCFPFDEISDSKFMSFQTWLIIKRRHFGLNSNIAWTWDRDHGDSVQSGAALRQAGCALFPLMLSLTTWRGQGRDFYTNIQWWLARWYTQTLFVRILFRLTSRFNLEVMYCGRVVQFKDMSSSCGSSVLV